MESPEKHKDKHRDVWGTGDKHRDVWGTTGDQTQGGGDNNSKIERRESLRNSLRRKSSGIMFWNR